METNTNPQADDTRNFSLNAAIEELNILGRIAFQQGRSLGNFIKEHLPAIVEKYDPQAAQEIIAIREERAERIRNERFERRRHARMAQIGATLGLVALGINLLFSSLPVARLVATGARSKSVSVNRRREEGVA